MTETQVNRESKNRKYTFQHVRRNGQSNHSIWVYSKHHCETTCNMFSVPWNATINNSLDWNGNSDSEVTEKKKRAEYTSKLGVFFSSVYPNEWGHLLNRLRHINRSYIAWPLHLVIQSALWLEMPLSLLNTRFFSHSRSLRAREWSK